MNRWVALVLLAATVALALRLPQLDNRPMHNDEAVNAAKFGELWEHGIYKYDPAEHHGPTLHYFTAAFCRLNGTPDFKQLSEIRLRLFTALVGVALVLLLPLIRAGLGRGAVAAAAIFTALSPAMVFYSRYWIHEELLVLFTFLALAAGWRFVSNPSWAWAAVAGAALGLMQATKETFVLAIAAAAGALALNWVWNRFVIHEPPAPALQPPAPFSMMRGPQTEIVRFALVALIVWFLVATALLTSFFTNLAGLADSVRTFLPWLKRAGGESPHIYGGLFYFERLFWFRLGRSVFYSEGLLLILALVGAVAVLRRDARVEGCPRFIRFLVFYTALLGAIYAAIPYKTPWCALGFLHGVILLAGVGAAVLWRLARVGSGRFILPSLLALGTAHLGWQAWRASFPMCADRGNPWVFAQTSPDLLNLVECVKSVVQAGAGDATLVKVITQNGDCWPLPWYLRGFTQTGWWEAPPEDSFAPVVIASASLKLNLDSQPSHVMVGNFQLRPRVFLELYVERGLWEAYLKQPPHATD